MRLRDIMSAKVVTVDAAEAAQTAWSRMQRQRIRHLVVTENGRMAGVLSDRDLGGQGGAQMRRGRAVKELMTARVATAEPQMTLREAANLMRGRLIGSLPVMEGERLVGIVTATDVLDELGRGSTRPTRRPEPRTLRMTASRRQAARRPVIRAAKQRARGKTTRRGRARQADSDQRTPLPGWLPRAVKRGAGRTQTALVPAYIRIQAVAAGSDDRAYIRRKLGMKLGKFASSIERVSVRLEDVNGPRGGVDQICRIKVVLSGLPSVVVERREATLEEAIDRALDAAERTVRRSVQRRRMQPIRKRHVERGLAA